MDELTIAFKIESPPSWLPIGRTAENNWRTVEIDCSYWFNMSADGEVVLMYKPSCGMSPYPLLTEREGDNIIWRPKSGELVEGVGRLQAFFEVGTDVIGSSDMISCEVDSSLLGVDPGTDPGQTDLPWALDIIAQIAEMSGHYPKIENGVLYVWDSEQEDWVQFQGGGGSATDAVLYTPQSLSDSQKAQARTNVGAGTYSKPSGGIPKSDLASAVQTSLGKADTALQTAPVTSVNNKTGAVTIPIPTVPTMATDPNMSDWTSGKTVDAAALKTDLEMFRGVLTDIYGVLDHKASASDIPTAVSDLTNDSGFVTAQQAAASAPVQSVNGKTGTVVLGASDVHALPDSTVIPPTVTEQTVAGWGFTKNTGTYSKPSGGIPKSDLASAVQTSLGKADTALQSAPVTSVNNKTGAVTLTASDVGALPSSTSIPTKVSDLTNDSGFQTAAQVQTAIADKADKSELPTASTSNPIMDGVASAGSSAAYARGDHVHPTDTSRLATTGNAYRTASIPMGHLDATSTATVMTATVDGITELRDGVCMWLLNGVVTSASGFTLNVNGLGAKPCYSSLAAASRSTTIFNVNYALLMIYNSTRVDGGCWDIVYGVDTNTTYTPVKLGFGYGICTTAAATAAKTASISSYALTAGGIVSIKFENDVPANATLNITSKGAKAIYHRGAAITAGVIKAGDTATFIYSTYYHLIAIDRKYLTLDDLPIYNGGVS